MTFSLHGQAIIAHRLVLRVVRDGLAKEGRLGGGAPGCSLRANGARGGAFGVAGPCGRAGRSRAGDGSAGATAGSAFAADDELAGLLLGLRLLALSHLNGLGDSRAQAIVIGEPLRACQVFCVS